MDWWAAHEVNVKAAVLITRALLNNVAKEAVLINISAGLAHVHPTYRHSAYSTSKIAAVKIYEYVQFENPDLRVFSLHPGVIPTDMGKKSTTGKGISSAIWLIRVNSCRYCKVLLTWHRPAACPFLCLVGQSRGCLLEGKVFVGKLGRRRD
jgi:NAD(P)-dependent dehydrogenase (short-subunit alcohol dehydrogenase family)